MVDSNPLPPDTNYAPDYLIPCGILAVIGVSLSALLGLSLAFVPHPICTETIISLLLQRQILSFSEHVGAAIAAGHEWGHRSHYVSQNNRTIAFKCLFAVELMWIFSKALVRISVACSSLRLSRCAGSSGKLWKWGLRYLIGVQFLVLVGWLVLQFFNCYPSRGMWEPVPEMVCWPNKYSIGYCYTANGIMILIDFILATMRVQLIRTLQRPLHEKVLISCLMAMGLLATGIAAHKISLSQEVHNGDPLSTAVKLSFRGKLEKQLGLIAACLPCLKAQMEVLLHKCGVLKTRVGHLPTFSISSKERFGRSPSKSPQDSDGTNSEDANRHSSDAGSASFATNTMGSHGTAFTFKTKSESSQVRELRSANSDV